MYLIATCMHAYIAHTQTRHTVIVQLKKNKGTLVLNTINGIYCYYIDYYSYISPSKSRRMTKISTLSRREQLLYV